MPNSSRRKQSKPQHLLNEDGTGEDNNVTGNQAVTSSHYTAGNQSTQELTYGSKVMGQHNGDQINGSSNIIHTNTQHSESENGYETSDSELLGDSDDGVGSRYKASGDGDSDCVPHDLSMKQVDRSDRSEGDTGEMDHDMEDEGDGDGMLPIYTPPSDTLTDRFCVYCNAVKKSPADLERHLRKHTGDRPFQCKDCTKSFKSKRSLQYHEYMNHGTEPADSNIAQRYQMLRKRRLQDQISPPSLLTTPTSEPSTSSSPAYMGKSPTLPYLSPSHNNITPNNYMASKRQRLDKMIKDDISQSSFGSAITPLTLHSAFDLQVARSIEAGFKAASSEDGQDLTRACTVCNKMFPKPSDLKRHMMCHTGEKPFRCKYCNKPFRAKSSMHYHLKATHGIEIELSPGLEERYLRMKTRAQINLMQRGHLTGASFPFVSEEGYHRDNLDIDEIEDDIKSTDSYFHTSGIGSDMSDGKSQGPGSNASGDRKGAIDLSMAGKGLLNHGGGLMVTADAPFQKNKISIQNETILITRLDGMNVKNGECESIYKCYLCGKMFVSLSKMQCHLSLHFDKQVVSYECCFCDEIFQFKTQMKNHIRRQHSSLLNNNNVNSYTENYETKDSLASISSPLQGFRQTLGQSSLLDNQFKCRYCRKSFDKQLALHKHMRLHFGNKNCFCRICGKSFKQYTSLQVHISRFHWKSAGKESWLRKKINFFNSHRFRVDSHDGMTKDDDNLPLDLIKHKTYHKGPQSAGLPRHDVTVVLPRSPPTLMDNGDISDTGTSHHSSDNNWSESLSDNQAFELDEGGTEIKTAPKRSLMPMRRRDHSPRSKSSRRLTPPHLQPQNHITSDNNVPLNYVKTECQPHDSNNNDSNHSDTRGRLSPDNPASKLMSPESILPGYSMNATSHLLMAKALAAHQSLSQHFNNTSMSSAASSSLNQLTSSSLLYPPHHLPPSLAAMSQMMTLPVSIHVPTSTDTHTNTGTSKSPSPASYTSSKSDTSPDHDNKEAIRDSLVGFPRVQWGQHRTTPDWTFNMYCPPETNHTDGRKVTSLSRTHSRLGIVHSPINRESMCKPTNLPDGRTVYKCPFCSKEFVSFSDINRHMDFHEDIRPYKCQFCDYFARTNSQLKVHMMRHQGIREFCCKLCNYKGVTQSDLNRHMKSQIHMLKSRNACTYCEEGFVTNKNLEKHLDGNCIVKMQKLNGELDMPLQESIA